MRTLLLFCIFVVALVARPTFSSVSPVSGRRYVAEETVTRDVEKGEEKLKYDVTLNDAVILVDQMENVESITCEDKMLTMEFSSEKTNIEVGKILVGGDEWGCIHPEYNKPLPFYRKVVEVVKSESDKIVLLTELVSLNEVFSQADVNYKNIPNSNPVRYDIPDGTVIGQATPIDDNEIIDLPDEESTTSRRSSDKFSIDDFSKYYFSGDTITVTFSYNISKYGKEPFRICLMLKRFGFDKKISCKTQTLSSSGSGTVSFPVLSRYESNNAYIDFKHDCFLGKSFESDEFGINPSTILLTPTHGDEFYQDNANNNIEVSWYASSSNSGKVVELALIKDGIFDKTVQTWKVSLSKNKFSIKVQDLPKSADSGDYKFRILYSCALGNYFCDIKEFTDTFSLSRDLPGQKSITINEPREGSIFNGNSIMDIKWNSSSMSSSDSIKVSICRDSYGIDPCPLRNLSTKNSGSLRVRTNSSWKGSSTYYVLIRYNCKLFWCSNRESRRFAINFTPQFEFTSTPKEGTIVDSKTLTVEYKRRANATIKSDKKITVKLMRQVPFLDLVHNGATVTTTASSTKQSFTITEGTVFPLRFMIAYDCLIAGYFCKREYSPTFFIPTKYHKGWNDNPTERIELFSIACGDKCKGKETNPFCKVCSQVPGLKSSIDVACDKCYFSSDVQAYDFTLNVNWFGVTASSLAVEGQATANIDFTVQFDASYKLETDFEIAHYDIFGVSFSVGPVKVAIGARVALNATLGFGVEGTALVKAGFDATVGFHAFSSKGGVKGDSNDVKFGLTKYNKHTPTLDLRVNVWGKAGIKPIIELNVVDLLRFWIALHPYLKLTGSFQVPPFNPGKYPKDSLIHLGVDCTALDHYTEYDLSLLIEASMGAKLITKEWNSRIFTLLDLSLVSGCLFPSKGPLDEETYTILSTLDKLGYNQDGFKTAFVDHLVKFLPNAEASRLDVTILSGPTPSSINVKVQAFQTEDAHENIDLKNLTSLIRNEYSDFYDNDFGRKLKSAQIGPYSP